MLIFSLFLGGAIDDTPDDNNIGWAVVTLASFAGVILMVLSLLVLLWRWLP